VAAPGYAGIPVTHRGLSASLAVVTGHEDPAKGESTLQWEHLAAGADTLVFLMGAERLPGIVQRLLEHGRSPDSPAALVSRASHADQRTVAAVLGTIVERCREVSEELSRLAPAVLVVGEVARLRERLAWFEARPLAGKRIVITRPADQTDALGSRIREAGGEAIHCPLIAIRPLPPPDLSLFSTPYDWVVVSSSNGIYSLAAGLRQAGRDLRILGPARIAAVGQETARAVEACGLRVDFVPSRFVAEQLAAEFPEPVRGRRILIPRAREGRDVLPELWREQGATVDVLPVYENVPDEGGAAALRALLLAGEVDAVTFTASSAVRNFTRLLPAAGLEGVRLVCIGPVTAQTARQAGLPVSAVAETYSVPGLVEALQNLFASNKVNQGRL
jgi:uroporphyrinogen III methyltransferase / synthase